VFYPAHSIACDFLPHCFGLADVAVRFAQVLEAEEERCTMSNMFGVLDDSDAEEAAPTTSKGATAVRKERRAKAAPAGDRTKRPEGV
jgi:hypothetical protein